MNPQPLSPEIFTTMIVVNAFWSGLATASVVERMNLYRRYSRDDHGTHQKLIERHYACLDMSQFFMIATGAFMAMNGLVLTTQTHATTATTTASCLVPFVAWLICASWGDKKLHDILGY